MTHITQYKYMSNMSPFEIRLELLKMAKGRLENAYRTIIAGANELNKFVSNT